ncbi:predicted protein, partial [Nematostella vectensis]
KSPYRTITGVCNNLRYKNWGAANTPFTRVARPAYADMMSKPRAAVGGGQLTNARKVSFTLFQDKDRPSKRMSHMAMIWGQFIDHDITHGAQPNINCENKCGLQGECFGIAVPKDDPHFWAKGVRCIQLKRNVPINIRKQGKLVRQQVNTKSSFIDGSMVYDDDPVKFEKLRDPSKRWLLRLKDSPAGGAKLLPPAAKGEFCRSSDVKRRPCFMAGDGRVNENPGLSSMHTIFAREHNRIATELKKLNRHWSPDKVFQEARKIVGAQIQHITYNEFLPLIFNETTLIDFDLKLLKPHFYNRYHGRVHPSIFNSFAGAAFRFGHSMIRNVAARFKELYQPINSVNMNRTFDPLPLYAKKGVDAMMRGLATDPAQQVDAHFSKFVQEQLVLPDGMVDLVSLNIQRGREHGLPGYNTFRKLCRLRRASSFLHFRREISSSNIQKLRKVYKHVDDVDLFAGGIMEIPVKGGSLGPTFTCLVANQFARLRRGDRFWYERPGRTGFTWRQLQSIRKISLARIICDNGDNVRQIQPRALNLRDKRNKLNPCSKISRMSLNPWLDVPWHNLLPLQ